MVRMLAILLFTALWMCVSGQITDTTHGSLDPSFRTLIIERNGNLNDYPVIMAGTDDNLTFIFDELAEDRSYLRYRIIHCNSDWRPSQLLESEYLDGFNVGEIDDYAYSRGTLTHYVNYSFTIPNSKVSLKHSGNYLAQVFREENPDEVVLQFRFYVSEQSAVADGKILTVTDIDYNAGHQQLELTVDCTHSPVENPFSDLRLVIEQNGRQDNAVTITHPLRVSSRRAFYEHQPALIFKGGNEYRRFETVSTMFPSLGVESIGYSDPYYHFNLYEDFPRDDQNYLYDQTMRGGLYIREYNSEDSNTEADYAVVHFTLDAPYYPDNRVYLEGDITDRKLNENSLMTYNSLTGKYEKIMLLKQGQYNYQYLSGRQGKGAVSGSEIEGDHYQTGNEYRVRCYTRVRGERADRLIGYSIIK